MRPVGRYGEPRQALLEAFGSAGACTKRDAANLAQVGYAVTDYTVRNMLRTGELRLCGTHKSDGSKVREGIYERNPGAARTEAPQHLEQVVLSWASAARGGATRR